jgi:protein-S-isoprenylcysteine O-methyltransferase Ste14
MEERLWWGMLLGWLILALPIFVLLFFISAPYGRHFRKGWGPGVGSVTGWILMELPAASVFAVCALSGGWPGPVEIAFLVMWQVHYINRTLVYPFRQRSQRRISLLIIVFAVLFNVMNGYLNGRYIGLFSSGYDVSWFWDPRFIVGAALFVTGFVINLQSDEILLRMRRAHPGEYSIPRGGLFDLVSCPNYLGEILEWTGWAIATWSLPGLAFALWTAANLLPRARTNHGWYRETFPDYPRERRAVIPYLY